MTRVGEFGPGCFLHNSITIIRRGCIRKCPWCHVPAREGRIRELEHITPGHIVQDNNLLACSKSHINKVFEHASRSEAGHYIKWRSRHLAAAALVPGPVQVDHHEQAHPCARYFVKPLSVKAYRI